MVELKEEVEAELNNVIIPFAGQPERQKIETVKRKQRRIKK